MKHNLVSKQSVLDFNKKYDDELVYEEVVEQVEEDLDSAIESLLESIEDVKERFYRREHKNTLSSDFLTIDTEIVDNCDFVNAALRAVSVSVVEEKKKESSLC